jgi:type I restriction enzyme, S subunit
MIDGIRPYADLKPTGLPWLPELPGGWEVRRAKYSFREVDDRSERGDEELLSVSHKTGVTPRSQKNITMFMAETYEDHKVCRPDDIVVNTMWAWMAAIGVSRHIGIVSPAYGVYRPRRMTQFEPTYLDYLLRTEAYRAEYVRSSRGITTSRLRLYPPDFLNIPFVRPPIEEQRLIVRFLVWHGAQSATLIRAKQKLIKLLEEQKHSIIHRAVTRGVDPTVRLKPTGVEWLGDIPAHWTVSRIKNELQCLNRQRVPLSSTERGAMIKREYDYYGASGVIDKVENFIFDDDLLLIAEDGANLVLRNLPLAIIARGKFWVNNHAHILKPKRGNLEFFASLLETLNFLPWISGAAQPKLTQDRLMAIAIPAPPPEEQDRIVIAMSGETSEIRGAIDRTKREIRLVAEYRTRMIADVVTGKLDVREAAKGMPDKAFEPEPLDETDDLMQDESTAEDLELEATDAA